MQSSQHEQVLQLLITGGFLDPTKLQQARNIISSVAPSPVSGSLEEAAKRRADEYTRLQGSHERPDITHHDYTKGFIDGALNERAEEYEMQRLYEWIMDENRKGAIFAFTSGWLRNVAKEIEFRLASRPSLDIDKVVEQMREENPYCGEIDFSEDARIAWEKSCDKLKELLNQPK